MGDTETETMAGGTGASNAQGSSGVEEMDEDDEGHEGVMQAPGPKFWDNAAACFVKLDKKKSSACLLDPASSAPCHRRCCPRSRRRLQN